MQFALILSVILRLVIIAKLISVIRVIRYEGQNVKSQIYLKIALKFEAKLFDTFC